MSTALGKVSNTSGTPGLCDGYSMNQSISKNRVRREYIVVYVVVKTMRQSTVAVGKGVLGYVTRTSPSEVYRWVGFNMIFSSLTKHRICNKFPGTFERSKVPKTRRAVDPLRLQAGVSPSCRSTNGPLHS